MSATDELRRMLDESGVESWDMQTRGLWFGITGNDHKYEAHEQRDGLLLIEAMSLTPEQAIAATFGIGKLTAEQVEEAVYRNCKFYEGGEVDVESITDELNAALGEPKRAVCSECGTLLSDYILCTPCAEKLAVKR